jgi:hypothetical protein
LWYHTRTIVNLRPSYRFSETRRDLNAGFDSDGTIRTRRSLIVVRLLFARLGERVLRSRSIERSRIFSRELQKSVNDWSMIILSRRIREFIEARTRLSRDVTSDWKSSLESRTSQNATSRTRALDHCDESAFEELRENNWIARERRDDYDLANVSSWEARNLARLDRLITWLLRECSSDRRSSSAIDLDDDSYLIDSVSSHMLVSKIKSCMFKYKQSIRWNCEWLIKSVIVYLIVLSTWILVIILELIHAKSLDFERDVFIR